METQELLQSKCAKLEIQNKAMAAKVYELEGYLADMRDSAEYRINTINELRSEVRKLRRQLDHREPKT